MIDHFLCSISVVEQDGSPCVTNHPIVDLWSHAGERLTHGAEVLLNRLLLNILAAGGQYSMSHKMCKDLEEGVGSLMEGRFGCSPIQVVNVFQLRKDVWSARCREWTTP